MTSDSRPVPLLIRAWHVFDEHHCMLRAASIAYYVMFSIVPVVTVAVGVLGWLVPDARVRQLVIDGFLRVIRVQSGPGAELVSNTLRHLSKQSRTLTLVSVFGLLWSGGGILGAVRSSLNVVWNATPPREVLRRILSDAGAMFDLGLLLLASFCGTTVLYLFATGGLHQPDLPPAGPTPQAAGS